MTQQTRSNSKPARECTPTLTAVTRACRSENSKLAIAQENQPHLTNDVSADSWVGDKGWARREGMVAFPGYPLSLGTQVLGVVAAFRRNTFTEATLATFKAVAGGVAQFIQRKRVEESRNLLASIVDGSDEAIVGRTLDGTIVSWNGGATRLYGYSAEEILGRPVSILVPPGNLAELLKLTSGSNGHKAWSDWKQCAGKKTGS